MVERRFACTRCGKCCNRAPELELGEAGDYADTFVLQLLMRIYSLPRSLADYESAPPREDASAEFYESKRLLNLFAAASWNAKVRRGERVVDYVQYLSLSVLPLDLGRPECPELSGDRCGIYERRPLSCRSVPLHYSRPAAAAARDLDLFTRTPGFLCATGPEAPLVVAAGEIVDPGMLAARERAQEQARRDAPWKAALVKAMKAGAHGLPSPRAVEAQVARGALAVSFKAALTEAANSGLLDAGEATRIAAQQVALIDRLLGASDLSADTLATLQQMRRDYADNPVP